MKFRFNWLVFAPVRLLQLNSYDTFKSPDSKPRHLGSVISLIDLFVFVHPFFPYFPLFTNCTASAFPWRWCRALLCSVVLASHTDFAWKAVSWVMLIEFGTVRGNKLRCSYWPLKCSRISWERDGFSTLGLWKIALTWKLWGKHICSSTYKSL